MNIELRDTKIPGCYELQPKIINDVRGSFVKTFHSAAFSELGLQTKWIEEYYSKSKKGVLRGLHFQLPPYDHEKLVYCVAGKVLDVVVDLRCGSPTYGKSETFVLNSTVANMIYIPRGLAHGFYTLSSSATMMYKVSSVYSSDHDTGILWNTVDIKWPNLDPITSIRDSQFSSFLSFESPFQYKTEPHQ